MVSPDSKKICRMENLDRVSQLPEPLVLDILSRLPIEDSARASILSKTWKSFCGLYPILYFDHNLFALQFLVSNRKGGGKPDINQIRDMFMDDVDYHLSRARQLDSPIRKLALTVAINDSKYFSRVDTWLELVRQIHVEDLCIIVQTVDFLWEDGVYGGSVLYEFPVSVLASKGLRSVYVRGCKLGCETTFLGDPINKKGVLFSSLQQLCLSYVYINEDVLENLVRFCRRIEMLVMDNCTFEIELLELSKFPKLKKALIEIQIGYINHVDIVDTNLECFKFKCEAEIELHISPAACAYIRELTLEWYTINQPDLFKNLTATFPLLEELDLFIHDTDTLTAANNVLRKLKFYSHGLVFVKEIHIDCPSLTLLDCQTKGLTELYVDCPKLRVFDYCGTTVPRRVFFSSMTDLEESRCIISVAEAYDTLWLINLRAFLVLTVGNVTNVTLTVRLPPMVATFEPEELEAIEASPRYNVHLTLYFPGDLQNVAAFVDAMLWIIRPPTLTLCCVDYQVVKYLCGNLSMKSQQNICDVQLTHPCWMHLLEDFQIECSLDISNINEKLAALSEQCQTMGKKHIHFKFQWSYKM